MKVLLLLFFVFLTPIVIFLTTILYGGMSPTLLKESLKKGNIYTKMGSVFQNMDTSESDTDPALTDFISKWLTPSYIQKKAEEGINISSSWITGEKTDKPTLSFKEIKEDITINHPQLLDTVEQINKEAKNKTPLDYEQESPEEEKQTQDLEKSMDSITTLVKSDFSIKLDSYLFGLKQFYGFIRIVQPVLAGLLLLSLCLFAVLASTTSSKMKWIGTTLLIAGVWGFLMIFLTQFTLQIVSKAFLLNQNEAVSIASPIITEIVTHAGKIYTNYQGIVSIGMFLAAAICFIVGSLHKPQLSPTPSKTPSKQKKK